MTLSNFRFPTDVRFGVDSVRLLPELLKRAGAHRPLVVTDRTVAGLPVCQHICQLLERQGMSPKVYGEAAGNPVAAHVTAGLALYQQHDADCIVLLGGGCALDVGKAIALMVYHPGELFDYEDDKPGARPIDQALPLMVAIPTTAGTGSEVGGSTVISDDKTHAKVIIWSGRLIPRHVLADPRLTVSMPAAVTAATGMDALTHNIEAFLAKNYHPICDGIALEGVRLLAENLETAVSDGENLAARSAMLMASMMGALAFQKGLGITHSCAHALSTCFDLHHGLANAIMLVPCMRFNCEAVPERLARLGHTLGFTGSQSELADRFIDWLESLMGKIGIPAAASQTRLSVSDRLVEVALADSCHANNPRPCYRDDFYRLFGQALQV